MLCSVSTGKSGSKWLDRLRSSKGFPTADNLDLDHFLNNNNNNNSHDDDDDDINNAEADNPSASSPVTTNASNTVNANSNSESTQSDSQRVSADRTSENEWFDVMTDVLSDLFIMGGDTHQFSGKKKSARKQTNPKFCCVISTPDNYMGCARKEENAHVHVQVQQGSFNSDKNSNNGNADCGDYRDDDDVNVEEEKGGSGGDKELKGYSRSEVTVIDTSCGVWKFDKLVFRKKNIWKVREKKGKSFVTGTKKRKPNDLDSGNGNGNVGPKKKPKASNSDFACSKDVNHNPRGETREEEALKETCDELGQIPTRRFQFSRSPRASKKNGSSVILLNKKSDKNLP